MKHIFIYILVSLFLVITPVGQSYHLNNDIQQAQTVEVAQADALRTDYVILDMGKVITSELLTLSEDDQVFTTDGSPVQEELHQYLFLKEHGELTVYNSATETWRKIDVQFVDREAPVIQLEKESFEFIEGETIDVSQAVIVTDAVDPQPTLETQAPDTYVLGVNEIVYTATDASGNQSSKKVVVTIKEKEVKSVESKPAQTSSSTSSTSKSSSSQPATTTTSNYQANYIYYGNRQVYYTNGGYANGENYINSHESNASTWGGTQSFAGNDGLSTHFIAHYYGGFSQLWNLSNGDIIVVTDSQGTPYRYRVNAKYKVNRLNPTNEQYDRITSTGGGERIILQTCVDSSGNILWIIEAQIAD